MVEAFKNGRAFLEGKHVSHGIKNVRGESTSQNTLVFFIHAIPSDPHTNHKCWVPPKQARDRAFLCEGMRQGSFCRIFFGRNFRKFPGSYSTTNLESFCYFLGGVRLHSALIFASMGQGKGGPNHASTRNFLSPLCWVACEHLGSLVSTQISLFKYHLIHSILKYLAPSDFASNKLTALFSPRKISHAKEKKTTKLNARCEGCVFFRSLPDVLSPLNQNPQPKPSKNWAAHQGSLQAKLICCSLYPVQIFARWESWQSQDHPEAGALAPLAWAVFRRKWLDYFLLQNYLFIFDLQLPFQSTATSFQLQVILGRHHLASSRIPESLSLEDAWVGQVLFSPVPPPSNTRRRKQKDEDDEEELEEAEEQGPASMV